MKVALTGGSGVVGRALLRLLLAGDHEVRSLVRSDSASKQIAAMGSEPVRGDVLEPHSLRDLVADADWVFHVAGVNELCPSDADKMADVNIEGSLNVLEACQESNVGRLIHTSSAVALGERAGSIGSEVSEHRGSYLSKYEETKTIAERLMLAERGDLDLVVVNPSSVQGPGRATGTGKLIIDAINGRLPFLFDATFSLVDIDDCARGHILAAKHGLPGKRYVLSGSTLTIKEAIDMFATETGIAIEARFLPGWMVTVAASLVQMPFRLVGGRPPLCPEMARVLQAGAAYDGSLATRQLGLDYTPLRDTIARAVSWYRARGYLN